MLVTLSGADWWYEYHMALSLPESFGANFVGAGELFRYSNIR
jgi:hypothetical protein